MTKIDLITGFLGSGKTTLLKKYLKYLLTLGEKVCILEFDYGAVNIDMMLLQEFNDKCDIEMVAGGCDFDCHQRRFKTKLISMGMKHYDRVIIEPSGIFNPIELFDALNEEPLNSWYEVGSVISVVDSQNLTYSFDSKELFLSQLSYSGIVYLSKTNNISEEKIAQYIDSIIMFGDQNCVQLKADDFLFKTNNELDTFDFERLMNAGYKEPTKLIGRTDYDQIFNSVYILDSKITIEKLQSLSSELMSKNSNEKVMKIINGLNLIKPKIHVRSMK